MYLTQPVHQAVQQDPDRLFAVFGERRTTVREAADVVSRLAGGLAGLGVGTDDRVALLALNSDRFFEVVLGIAWADAAVVPVNTRWSAAEMAYSLNEAEVGVLVVDDAFLPMAAQLKELTPCLRTIVHCGEGPVFDGVVSWAGVTAGEPVEDAHRQGDALAGIFYTGGTTGYPKGVMLGHRQLFINALGSAAAQNRIPHGGGAVLVAPAFHLAGLGFWLSGMLLGMTTLPLSTFDPVAVLRAIEAGGAKQILLVPTMLQMIVDHPGMGAFDLSSLEVVYYGAAPISDALLTRAREAFGSARFTQAYGMTELSPTATLLVDEDHDDPVRRRSAGRAAPHARVRIVDPAGREVPRGTVGEIVVAGEHVMLGYWRKPEETAATVRDGWLHTGDGGYMDEKGYVFIVDRIKDMIISGGENVYSTEVENAVAKHPSVAQVAVVARPDDKWGERVHAVVTLVAGGTLSLEELRVFCGRHIAGYKCPRSLDVVEALPMSAAGKVLKRQLREG